MNPTTQTLGHIAEIITKGTSGLIIVPSSATPDALASATSLYLGLSKLGKTVGLVSASPITADFVGADKFQTSFSLSGDNLVVSFPYTEGAVDKVDYNIEGNKFNLIVSPRQGHPKLNPDQVQYSYSGGVVNFIITIDAPNLNSLGSIYTNNTKQFQGKDLINIDRHLTNAFFGTANYVNKTSSSTTQLVLQILQQLQIEIDRNIASNLYAGLAAATNNFTSYSVNAETFETASQLLKLGAIKKPTTGMRQQANSGFAPRPSPFDFPSEAPMPFNQPISPFSQPFSPQSQSTLQPMQSPPPILPSQDFQAFPQSIPQPMPQPTKSFETQAQKPIGMVEKEPQADESSKNPQDWLKPNIFGGGGLT